MFSKRNIFTTHKLLFTSKSEVVCGKKGDDFNMGEDASCLG